MVQHPLPSSLSRCGLPVVVAALLAVAPSLCLAVEIPKFAVQFLGNGNPIGVNNQGTVAGSRLVAGSNYQPLVSVLGSAWQPLPVPAETVSAFPTDLNDSGVIIGVTFDSQFQAVGVRWVPDQAGVYSVELIPRLPGDDSSYPLGLNNHGDVVGARRALGYVPASSSGWWDNGSSTPVDLLEEYGLPIYPTDLNDRGTLISGVERLDLVTGESSLVGNTGPSNYQPINAVDLNNSGQIVGYSILRSTSLNIVTVFRYTPGVGWETIAGTSKWTVANDINELGDVTYGELGAGVSLNGIGTFPLFELIDPVDRADGWTVTGSSCFLNDSRMIAGSGKNLSSGATGGLLLVPNGVLPAPSAPGNLSAAAHPSTPTEPYDSIDLAWRNSSPLTKTFDLQRRVSNSDVWVTISLVPPGTGTFHQDTTVSPGITYDYRIRSVGIAGPGEWSEIASAKAPSPSQEPGMHVTALALSGRSSRRNVTITGRASVRDDGGVGVSGATLQLRWTLPNGSNKSVVAKTNSRGDASFSIKGPPGPYQVTILDVRKSGYRFDAAESLLTTGISQ